MLEIDRNSPTPIFRQIEEYILQEIRTGELKPGDRIPSQYELARECQVSRATVQKALDRLIMEEMIYYQPGKGIYVAPTSERERLPVLQSVTKSLRSLGYRVWSDLLLVEEIAPSRSVAEALGLTDGSPIIHIKRLQYVNEAPIMLQAVYVEAERFRGIMKHDLRRESLTEIIQAVGDIYISGSAVTVAASTANWEESRTLGIQPSSPLLNIEEIDYDDDEQPFRFSRNKLRGDHFRVAASTLRDRDIALEYRLQPGTVNITLL